LPDRSGHLRDRLQQRQRRGEAGPVEGLPDVYEQRRRAEGALGPRLRATAGDRAVQGRLRCRQPGLRRNRRLSLDTRETTSVGPSPGGGGALPRKRRFGAETLFRGATTAAGTVVLIIIVAIAVFLIAKAVPAIRPDGSNFLTEKNWFTGDTPPKFGVAAIAVSTVQTAVIALLMAVPVSMGIALFLSHYAPKALANVLGFMIDLLAAV